LSWCTKAFGAARCFGASVHRTLGREQLRLAQDFDLGGTVRSRPPGSRAPGILLMGVVGLAATLSLFSLHLPARYNSTRKKETSMAPSTDNGIITKLSNHSVDETVQRLKGILQSKGITVFAVVDHSGEAEKAGMKMRPTKLLIFGSPKTGTPIMLAAPSTAIDLPLKILISEDAQGKVWISYNSPAYLQQRHGIPQELLPNIAVVEAIAGKAAV